MVKFQLHSINLSSSTFLSLLLAFPSFLDSPSFLSLLALFFASLDFLALLAFLVFLACLALLAFHSFLALLALLAALPFPDGRQFPTRPRGARDLDLDFWRAVDGGECPRGLRPRLLSSSAWGVLAALRAERLPDVSSVKRVPPALTRLPCTSPRLMVVFTSFVLSGRPSAVRSTWQMLAHVDPPRSLSSLTAVRMSATDNFAIILGETQFPDRTLRLAWGGIDTQISNLIAVCV